MTRHRINWGASLALVAGAVWSWGFWGAGCQPMEDEGPSAPDTTEGDAVAIDLGVFEDAPTTDDTEQDEASDVPAATDSAAGVDGQGQPVHDRNGCGGVETLAGQPLMPCGPCGDGVWVCDGQNATRCAGAGGRNACGGCGPVLGELGGPCGPCGGTWQCEGDGGAQVCVGAQERNACGGCAALTNTPNFGCFGGLYACDGPNEVVCAATARNACGGTSVLAPAPGSACGRCGTGRLVCDGRDGTMCVDDAVGLNACGGCEALPDVPGAACGCGGRWTCAGDTLVCDDDAGRNACGGCGVLAQTVGQTCMARDGAQGRWTCDGADAVACAVLDRNACGGSIRLDGQPGEPCGPCADGVIVCATPDAVVCVGERQRNACGGCGVLPGASGERCATDRRWACEGDTLVCVAAPSRNACGGVSVLATVPGSACGTCAGGIVLCTSREEVACFGANRRPQNVCGGCTELPPEVLPGQACGTCLTGSWRCDDAETLTCVGERPEVLRTFYADRDGDTFGNPDEVRTACARPFGFTAVAQDCDDRDPSTYPGADEVCDGVDNDCDGNVDEGFTRYRDDDGDGVGRADDARIVCANVRGWAELSGDCDDADPRVFPGQTLAFTAPRPSGSFDYDCDGIETPQDDVLGVLCLAGDRLGCGLRPPLGVFRQGWEAAVPDCGASASWLANCTMQEDFCTAVTTLRSQACR